MAHVIDGKRIAAEIRESLRVEVQWMREQQGRVPGLAVIIVGDDPASKVYVRMKRQACEAAGMASFHHELPGDISEAALLEVIKKLNADPTVHGILTQLPLPDHISERAVIEAIAPEKDVDGFHPYNVGMLAIGAPLFVPCTPFGVMELLRVEGIDPKSKHVVVVGRSNIVGKPMAMLMLAAHATVTMCHSRSVDLPGLVRAADILVAAVGKPKMISGDWIREGAVVIDVGTNRLPDGSLCGDVDFASAVQRAGYITPSPGGVGPMTIAMLLKNTVMSARRMQV
ncbi:MAG: bifunctional methylenetetrahydrofolate dehydrogenase/methenyltetrahydrofolate cyclohydrolase FolD [Magnetococcales bacterium]|nr:bifunctional methylenetetrahydrofolate dehydrogenase/methenyltetrahydrofolate cyclohydrolase FolD [Magnetococcales bacterium]NGZ04970.1 bifunctional methylenetetrahydrofolate dehydrogenase/methenyltetrahydrofolate cyclohydrolase FolD [Magnetococcales bacterium]